MLRPLPALGLLLTLSVSSFAATGAPDRIELRSGILSGPEDEAGLPARLRLSGPELISEGGPTLLKFDSPVLPEAREHLEGIGARWLAHLGERTALVLVPAGHLDRVRNTPGLAWSAPFHPGLRIAPEVAALAVDSEMETYPITVRVLADADLAEIAARLEALGLPLRSTVAGRSASETLNERAGRLVLTPTPAQVVSHRETIAGWPEVLWLDRGPRYRLANDASAWVGQSGLDPDERTPLYDHGLFGDGQTVAVMDTGLDADSCFFEDPAIGLPPVHEGFGPGSPDPLQRKVTIVNFLWTDENPADPTVWDTQGHGTHVAGSVAGDSLATPGRRDPGDGMAPAAKLVIQDLGYGSGECGELPALLCVSSDVTLYFEQAFQQGARIHSNSWTWVDDELPVNLYNDASEDADEFMWTHPDFLILFAAGNSGAGNGDTVASPSTAKNVVSVGATARGLRAGTRATFSSVGNTHDGRFKPDVFAPGSGVISAANDQDVTTGNCDQRSESGTSMATPTMAGFAAQVREYFERGYYPTGAPVVANGLTPSAALLRAVLINSATPLDGEPEMPPHAMVGWGRVLLDNGLVFAGDSRHLFAEDVQDRFGSPFDPAEVQEIEILDDSEPLKIVVTWTDYPSNPAATINLVNDLDLVVTSPGGAVYRGNVFAGGVSQTGGIADRLNNVEVVRVEEPEAGTWEISISAHAVPQPPQGYALVVTGRVPVQGVALERTSLTLDDSVGGNGDGVLEPGEWVDLPLTLRNTGDTEATTIGVTLESLSPFVEVVGSETSLPDLPAGEAGASTPDQLRIRLASDLPCTDPVDLRFTYRAEGYLRSETSTLPTGVESVIERDDLEGPTGWAYVPAESTATSGEWLIGDPVGTSFQPEDDVTPDPGVNCLYTGANPTGNDYENDVGNGVTVARSGAYDLSGHPEARLRISRWFFNSEPGNDPEDYFRIHIRENSGSPDVLLEGLDHTVASPRWTARDFRVADYLQPGPLAELRVAASDGYNQGAVIEAAIDEIVFWEPVCQEWNPAPNLVTDLSVAKSGDDLRLMWNRPALDPQHGEPTNYRIYRSESVHTGFALRSETGGGGESLSWLDTGAAGPGTPSLFAYEIVTQNAGGDGDSLP